MHKNKVLSGKEEFFKKRDKLMLQFFFDQEYKKRNFLITNDITKAEGIFNSLCENITNNPDDDYRLNLDDYTRRFKFIIQDNFPNSKDSDLSKIYDESLLSLNTAIPKREILCNYIARKYYSIPLYVLMRPLNMVEVLLQLKNKTYKFKPFIPEYVNKADFTRNYFLSAVFSYCNTEYRGYSLSDREGYLLHLELERAIQGNGEKNIALLETSIKCSNGNDLSDDEFKKINKEISNTFYSTRSAKKQKADEEDSEQREYIKQRLIGLLHYDFKLALAAIGKKAKIDEFIDIFYSIIDALQEDGYDSQTKRKYEDPFKYTSMCIKEKKLIATPNSLKAVNPPQIFIPKHLDFYTDYQAFYSHLKNNETFDSKLLEDYNPSHPLA